MVPFDSLRVLLDARWTLREGRRANRAVLSFINIDSRSPFVVRYPKDSFMNLLKLLILVLFVFLTVLICFILLCLYLFFSLLFGEFSANSFLNLFDYDNYEE